MYKVQKKDGSLQDFDRNKIINGVIKAGGSSQDAESIALQIEAWLPTVAENGVVNSFEIRTKGLEVLRTINPAVASSFESYQKSA